jgi:4-amino-4-deoxy-L-arabinose transferase-like glycosyltransferase
MTKRRDYISLWWSGSPRDQDVFWSKPVLSFWIMSLGMRLAGIGWPGHSGEMALGHAAEWAVRTPFCLLGVLGIYAVYLLGARLFSRRAGVLSAVVVATAPMYSLVARQAMTDMAFVGPMAMALALAALALFEERREPLPRKGRGRWSSWPHHPLFYGTIGLFALVTLPQLLIDSFQLKMEVPWGSRVVLMYGAVAMIPYYLGFLAFVVLAAQTQQRAAFYLYLAAILCGISILAKGLAGLGLPLIVFLAYLAFTWNWRKLTQGQLLFGLVGALIACAVVAVPWHHAMIIRHGWAFWQELFGDNHWRRMVLGRHGDRGSFEYFLRELGYALLPWIALAPAAVGWAVMRRPAAGPAEERRQAALAFGAVWFVAGYGLVSLSMTKFHHYVLPAVPGLALCIGCFWDELLREGRQRFAWATAVVGVPLLLLVSVDLLDAQSAAQRFLWLFSYDYIHNPRGRPWPDALDYRGWLTFFVAIFALGTLLLAGRRVRRFGSAVLGIASVVFTYFLLDGYMPGVAPYWSQKDVVAAYYKARRSPDERLAAYLMYWRGETFYTSNEIYEGPTEERTVFDAEGADERFKAYVERHRGRRLFVLCEKGQTGRIEAMLPAETRASFKIVHNANNKFALVQVDL